MKLILALTLVCVLVCHASPVIEDRDLDAAYEDHKKTHGLEYHGPEDDARKAIFKATDDIINEHNADSTKTSKLGHNQFSTWHDGEMQALNNYKQSNITAPTEPVDRMIADRSEPANLDWRDNNGDYVSPIQSQGRCGSCWTFSATATLESRYAINNGMTGSSIPKLSEQCLVDCAHEGSTSANTCGTGGNYQTAWAWVASIEGTTVGTITGKNPDALPKSEPGQNLLSKYPYVDGNYASGDAAHSCGWAVSKGTTVSTSTYDSSSCRMKCWSYKWSSSENNWVKYNVHCCQTVTETLASYSVTANSPSAMKTALQAGPVSVSITASFSKFKSYESGILQESDCPGNYQLDHAVNLIGYGADSSGNLYWLGRNSWGTWWGDQGYYKLERKTTDGPGTCGVLRDGAYPKI